MRVARLTGQSGDSGKVGWLAKRGRGATMLGELERLSDRELDLLLSELEYRTRSAIAVGDSAIIHSLVEEYVRAEEEATRRFRAWAEHHAARPSSAGGSASSQQPSPNGRQQPHGRAGAHETPKARAADREEAQHPGGAPARADGHAATSAQRPEQRRWPRRADRPRAPDRCAEDGVRWLHRRGIEPALDAGGPAVGPESPAATADRPLAGVLPAAQTAARRLDGDAGPMPQSLRPRAPRRRVDLARERQAATARVGPVRLMGDQGREVLRAGPEGYLALQDLDREPGGVEGGRHDPAGQRLAGHLRDGDRADTGSDTRGPARPWPVGLSPALPPEVCSVDHCDATADECERCRRRRVDAASGSRPGRPRVWGAGALGAGPASRRAATVTLSISPEVAGPGGISLVVHLTPAD